MQNPGSTTFWRHTYNLNLAGCRRRGLASRFAWPGRLLGTLTAALLAITIASRASANEVARWNQIATDASTVANTNSLTESCVFSILHVAIHDAVNAVESRYEPYLPRTSPAPGASVDAAIASAAHAAAAAILAARENDGENRTVQYTPGTKSGEYRPTPPDFTPAFNVHWGRVRPFVLKSSAQRRDPRPLGGLHESAFHKAGVRPLVKSWATPLSIRAERGEVNFG